MALALLVSLLFESGLETGTRFSFQYLIDQAIVPRHPSKLTLLLILLGVAGIVLTLLCVLADYLWAKLGNWVVSEIRSDLYLHLQSLSVDFFARRSSGDLLNCFISDTNELENCLVTAVPYGILGFAGVLFSSSFMATIHPLLAAATFCGLIVCFLVPRLLTARARRASLESHRQEGRLSSNVQEMLQSQSLVKVFGLERELWRRFSRENKRMVEVSVRASFLAYITQRIPSLLFFLLCLLVLGGSAILAFHGKLSVGEVVAFQVMVLGLGSAINNLTWLTPLLLGAMASMDRLNEVYRESPSTQELPGAPPLPALSRSICFENISFRYPSTPKDGEGALRDLSLEINKGEFAVVVGPSGSGKTSILRLLLRLYDPGAGRILLDGVDIRGARIASLRSQIGFVAQEILLFNMSVRDNVRMGQLDATDPQIWEALEAAEVADFVRQLPDGLDTQLGESGSRLSGGERQRLALARALIRQPQILALDEATSALDVENETELLITLRRLACERGITVIAVTHRLRMAPLATRVLVVRDGRIEAHGPHLDLLEKEGTYATLWRQATAE